jgi:hypothetical protein
MLNRHYQPNEFEEGASIPDLESRRLVLADSCLLNVIGYDPGCLRSIEEDFGGGMIPADAYSATLWDAQGAVPLF